MTYRGFAANVAIDIVQDTSYFCGLKEVEVKVVDYPEANEALGTPAGMYLLKRVPDDATLIKPMAFEDGGRASLDQVIV